MLVLFASAVLAAPVATPAEEITLATGVPVVRTLPPPSPTSVKVVGFVDVHATPASVFAVLLDFPGRLPTNPSLTAIVPYRAAVGNEQWWKFTVQKFGMNVQYHNHYLYDAATPTLAHDLDTTQENGIASNSGLYEIAACASFSPCTRLSWTVETDFGRALPGMIKTWLGRSAVEGFLVDLAKRAPGY